MAKTHSKLVKPFLKWAGGKRQLLPEIEKHVPKSYNTYFEPFIGAGALTFHLQPKKAVIGDTNEELINCYHVIKNNIEDLLEALNEHKSEKKYYYNIRELDRNPEEFDKLSSVERAARIIYLNKTCYNGLFRVNSRGHFNVPFGNYKNPKIADEVNLRAINQYLNNNDIKILESDFEKTVKEAKSGDFIYFDPPYDPVSDTASFTGYDVNGFNREDQKRLKMVYDDLTSRGIKCILSNSATNFILDLYKEYEIIMVSASRSINSVPTKRGKIHEILVKNFAEV